VLTTLARYEPHIYAITRAVVGLMYWFHGTTKLFDWPSGARASGTVDVLSLLGTAALIETSLGLLVTVGLWTRWAAFICSGQMAAAYFMRQLPFAILPIYQPPGILGESAVFNCFFFLLVAARGAGPFSVDSWLEKRQANVAAPG
jgi:putative oxidoreductase